MCAVLILLVVYTFTNKVNNFLLYIWELVIPLNKFYRSSNSRVRVSLKGGINIVVSVLVVDSPKLSSTRKSVVI